MKAIDEIIIYNPAGTPYIADDGGTKFPITDSCERTAKIMGEDSVRLVFNLKHKVTFDAFSFIEYNGQAFFLKERYVPKSVGSKEVSGTIQSAQYAYDVKFVSVANMLDKFVCYRHVEVDGQSWNEPEININGTLETLYVIIMGAIEQAASRLNTAWFFTEILHRIANNGLATIGGVVQPNTDNVRLTEGTQLLTFNFSGEKIANVCTTVANNFTNEDKKDTEWYITPVDTNTFEGATLHFAKCVKDDGTARVFRDYMVERDGEYFEGELKPVDYVQEWSGIPEVIVPYGSDRNMSYRSVKAIDEITQMQSTFGKRLRLQPNKTYKFTDKDGKPVTIETDANGAIRNSLVTTGIEVVKFFDEIYPQCHFKVTSVSQKNKRQDGEIIPEYTVEAVPVDNDGNTINREDLTNNGFYPIKIEEATTLSVRFESGLLNGREFEIANKTSKDQGATTYSLKFTIVADGSIEDGTLIPSGNFIPRKDDTFALFNMKMPDEYVAYAELELAKRAYEELITLQSTRPEIKCESDETIFDEDIQFGDVLIVYSDRFDSDEPFRSRVISYSYNLSNPRAVTFNLASAIMQGTLSSMNDLIADVTHTAGGLAQRAVNLSRRVWRDASEMAEMLDSITSEMMLVGNEKYQFAFTSGVSMVDGVLKVGYGSLQHTQSPYIEYVNSGLWEISEATLSTALVDGIALPLNDPLAVDKSFYLYAVVADSAEPVTLELSNTDHAKDTEYLLLGILSSEFEGERVFSRTNGFTAIAGGTITTEQIQDANRRLIIDFQSNPPCIIARDGAEIKGKFTFLSGKDVEEEINGYDYLKQALAKGSTDINGGLVATTLLQMKDLADIVRAGLSGLADDNILLWGGGSYDDALALNSNVITLFRKDGTARIGKFEILKDNVQVATTNGKVVIDDDEGISCVRPDESEPVVKVTPSELPALELMRGEPVTSTASFTLQEQQIRGRGVDDFTILSQVEKRFMTFGNNTTLTISGGITTEEISSSDMVQIWTEQDADENGTPSDTCMVVRVLKGDEEIGAYFLNSASRTSVTITLENAGEYTFEYHARVKSVVTAAQDIEQQMTVKVTGYVNVSYSYTRLHKQTTIAYKGFFSYQGDAAYFYYKDGVGLECKAGNYKLKITPNGIYAIGLTTDVPTESGKLYRDSNNFVKVVP